MEKKDKCCYCGNETFVIGRQSYQGALTPAEKKLTLKGQELYHVICLNCGTVIRSYVKNPQKLIIKNNKNYSVIAFSTICLGILIGNNFNKWLGYAICIISTITGLVFILCDKEKKDK